jgi:hypothetical protein
VHPLDNKVIPVKTVQIGTDATYTTHIMGSWVTNRNSLSLPPSGLMSTCFLGNHCRCPRSLGR